jgi:predicted metalloprotease with PDZ domain
MATGALAQTASSGDGASVSYRVSIPNPATENFQVSGTLRNIGRDTVTLHFPIWGPGAYDIVNFGAYVHDFTATSSTGRPLKVLRGDTNTFRIIGPDRQIAISYKVHDIGSVPNSLWFGLSDIEKDFAFANTPALFGYPDGYKNVPYTVTYDPPKGWDLTVGLDPAKEKNTFTARDYDELVDAPMQMGKFQKTEVSIKGKPHIITVSAPKKLDAREMAAIADSTRKVVEIVSGFFGDMPYDRYVFQHYLVIPEAGDQSFGALEHRNSSTYRMPALGPNGGLDMLVPVIAHEYWHAWSPKRIHVTQLGPFDYQSAPRTNSLWFAEGLTEYYAHVLLARNGMADPEGLMPGLEQAVASIRGKQQSRSIGELSTKISEVSMMEMIGLYTKGPLVGLLLDADIRQQTGNQKSLDDAMRYFNENYGKTGKSFRDEDIIPIMEQATGAKLMDFYNRYIVGTEPLPFDQYLPAIGMKVATELQEKPSLAAVLESVPEGWRIVSVNAGGSAEKMGMRAGDLVTGITTKKEELPATQVPTAYADVIATFRDVTGFNLTRDGKPMHVDAKIVSSKVETVKVINDPAASPAALAARKSIFGL